MALGAVLAAALTDGSARSKALWIDGLDVLKQPGTAGALYGVPIETIQLTEAGPGQVSSMSFTIEDPQGVVSVTPGQTVHYQDITRDVPLFRGFLDTFEATPLGLGRQVTVTCVGIEIVLDWMKIPSITLPASPGFLNGWDAVGQVVAAATGIGVPIHYSGPDPSGSSTQANPTMWVSSAGSLGYPGTANVSFDVVLTNVTLRSALAAIGPAILEGPVSGGNPPGGFVATVDFYGGLRIWDSTGLWSPAKPADYADLTVASPTRAPSNLQHSTAAPTRQVYISGTGAGSGLVSDGSGLPGDVALIDDTSVTTADRRTATAGAYLAAHGTAGSGTVTCEENVNVGAAGAEVRTGSRVIITDAQVGLTSYTAPMAQIDKSFLPSGAEVWTITYGAVRSGTQYLRQLTRAVLG